MGNSMEFEIKDAIKIKHISLKERRFLFSLLLIAVLLKMQYETEPGNNKMNKLYRKLSIVIYIELLNYT